MAGGDAVNKVQKATLRFLRHYTVTTTQELAERAQIPRETAYCRLETLARLGLARKVPSREGAAPRGCFWYEII